MMINECGCSMFNGIYQAYQSRIKICLVIKRFIQFPPQLFKDCWKRIRRFTGDIHTAGKRAIKMSVRANLARHHVLITRIDYIVGLCCQVIGIQTLNNAINGAVRRDLQRSPGQDPIVIVASDKVRVLNQHCLSFEPV